QNHGAEDHEMDQPGRWGSGRSQHGVLILRTGRAGRLAALVAASLPAIGAGAVVRSGGTSLPASHLNTLRWYGRPEAETTAGSHPGTAVTPIAAGRSRAPAGAGRAKRS